MKLIVGLGNPGKKYSGTRHNIGFQLIEEFLAQHKTEAKTKDKFQADIAQLELTSKDQAVQVLFAMPNTFMNLSGDSVQKLLRFYKISKEDMLVIHDDVALDLGRMRLVFDRGAGGQHGVEDIFEKLGGARTFHRLKIGVGPDPGGDRRADFVLAKFPKDDEDRLIKVLEHGLKAIDDWVFAFGSQEGLDIRKQERIIQKYNGCDFSLRKETKDSLACDNN